MRITTAKMDVIMPDGENIDVDMRDESETVIIDGTSVSTLLRSTRSWIQLIAIL